ncbi:hypothetical protein ACU8KH_01968 [Lachancea thermotolerans]
MQPTVSYASSKLLYTEKETVNESKIKFVLVFIWNAKSTITSVTTPYYHT